MAEKPWRPSNWAATRQRLGSDRPSFEAGADAILGALKEKPDTRYGGRIIEVYETAGDKLGKLIEETDIKGWHIFIPD